MENSTRKPSSRAPSEIDKKERRRVRKTGSDGSKGKVGTDKYKAFKVVIREEIYNAIQYNENPCHE